MSEDVLKDEMNEQPELTERRISEGGRDERLDKALQAISGGIARLERKLDRILALVTEARGRHR